jgi:hypothetical protein
MVNRRSIGSNGFYKRNGARADLDQQPIEARTMSLGEMRLIQNTANGVQRAGALSGNLTAPPGFPRFHWLPLPAAVRMRYSGPEFSPRQDAQQQTEAHES